MSWLHHPTAGVAALQGYPKKYVASASLQDAAWQLVEDPFPCETLTIGSN